MAGDALLRWSWLREPHALVRRFVLAEVLGPPRGARARGAGVVAPAIQRGTASAGVAEREGPLPHPPARPPER